SQQRRVFPDETVVFPGKLFILHQQCSGCLTNLNHRVPNPLGLADVVVDRTYQPIVRFEETTFGLVEEGAGGTGSVPGCLAGPICRRRGLKFVDSLTNQAHISQSPQELSVVRTVWVKIHRKARTEGGSEPGRRGGGWWDCEVVNVLKTV